MTMGNDVEKEIQQAGQHRYQKNMDFLAQKKPAIYRRFVNYQIQKCQFIIDPSSGKMDLNDNGQPLYNMDAQTYAQNEVQQFCAECKTGKIIKSVGTYGPESFNPLRFFGAKARELAQYCPFEQPATAQYMLPDFYPLIVFMGVGLGYHIVELLKQKDVHHAIIAESDFDHFAASLYCVDWSDVFEHFDDKAGRVLTFVFEQDKNLLPDAVWKQLIEYRPIFPLTTLFYNHHSNTFYWEVIKQINESLIVAVTGFGDYDDEINQLNHALHNLQLRIPVLPIFKTAFKGRVAVVGSGPSLDLRIDELRKLQASTTIISCGTSLKVLYRHGIKPDIHVETESDKLTSTVLDYINDDEWIAGIFLVGLAQLSPRVFEKFNNKALAFRTAGSVGKIFGQLGPQLEYTAPTVVNGAFSLATHYNVAEIFLFGVDFGFYSIDKHHASGTIYSESVEEGYIKECANYQEEKIFQTKSVTGEDIYTDRILFSAKRALESRIALTDNVLCKVYNCSDGVVINGTEHVPLKNSLISSTISAAEQMMTTDSSTLERFENYLLEHCTKSPDYSFEADVQCLELQQTETQLEELVKNLQTVLSQKLVDVKDVSLLCGKLQIVIREEKLTTNGKGLSMIIGSIHHLAYLLFSFSFTSTEFADKDKFLTAWQAKILEFLIELVPHYKNITHKQFDVDKDPWLSKSLFEPEN